MVQVLMYAMVTVKLGLVSRPDSMCHLTRKLSLGCRGSGLVAGVPPISIVQGVGGCPS